MIALITSPVTVISFGYGHGAPPLAHAVFDVRHHFRDPHISPELRELDGTCTAVIDAVMTTPGVPGLIGAICAAATAFLAGPRTDNVVIAVGCAGGRHRSVVIARAVTRGLQDAGTPVTCRDRDIHLPVISRPGRTRVITSAGAAAAAQLTRAEAIAMHEDNIAATGCRIALIRAAAPPDADLVIAGLEAGIEDQLDLIELARTGCYPFALAPEGGAR